MKTRWFRLLLVAGFAAALFPLFFTHAQESPSTPLPFMVRDIRFPSSTNLGYSSSLNTGQVLNDQFFIVLGTAAYGYEIWRTDGTEENTTILRETVPGPNYWPIRKLTHVGNLLYYFVETEDEFQLWRSDGTTSGTHFVKTVENTNQPSYLFPYNAIAVNDTFYFEMYGERAELWKSDGTNSGTQIVKIFDTPDFDVLDSFAAFNGQLYFTARDNIATGYELWHSDGTGGGTQMIKDTIPGSASGYPTYLTPLANIFYFVIGPNSDVLWRSDGTTTGTLAVKEINLNGDSQISSLQANNGLLYFSANDGLIGREPWISDGTESGTIPLYDIYPGSTTSSNAAGFTAYNGLVYFTANDNTHGLELWRTDGTSAGTSLFLELNPGTTEGINSIIGVVNGLLYFVADDGVHGWEIWQTDGTITNTQMLMDIYPGPDDASPVFAGMLLDTLIFFANDGVHGRELWRSNGTVEGTTMFFEIVPPAAGSQPKGLLLFNESLYFTAYDEIYGNSLWQSDGTEAGTERIAELFPSSVGPIYAAQMIPGNNSFFIQAGNKIWTSDGTTVNTTLIYNSNFYAPNQSPLQFVNNRLFFIGYDAVNHFELWQSDGTPGGTGMVKALIADERSWPYGLKGFNNWLYFTAYDNAHGWELWRSDGTSAGTQLFMDILPGTGYSSPSNITPTGTFFYFTAWDTGYNALWRSDGTVANTSLIKTISPQNSSQSPAKLVVGDSLLYFWADDGTHGRELWRSDGTPNGTFMVQDLTPGADGSALTNLVTFQDTVYFAFDNGVHGQELWRSSGSPGDAELVADLWPGPDGSYPQQMKFLDGKLYFSATDGVYGLEVWWYEPQSNAAARISDIAYGRYHALPGSFTLTDDFLFFVANDHPMGVNQELWAYQRSGYLSALPTVSPYLIMPGEPFTYTLVTGNYSLSPANQVVLSNTLPAEWVNVTLTSTLPITNTGTGTWSLGTLTAGETGVITQTGWLDAAANQEVTLAITSTLLADGVVYDTQVATQEINIPPSVNAGSNQVGGVGAIIALTATYSDPGLADNHTAMVAWGDGTVEPATVNSATHTIQAQHQYQDAGSFIVTITVFDSDGAAGSDTLLVTTYYQMFLPFLLR